MKLRVAGMVLMFCMVLIAQEVSAQLITYDGCVDRIGRPVLSIQSNIWNVAAATCQPDGVPKIYYNPMVLSWFAPQTRLFWYAHECAHHALGHTLGSAGSPLAMGVETEADIWAIKELKRKGLIDRRSMEVIAQDIAKTGPGDWSHLPGPERAATLAASFRSGEEAPKISKSEKFAGADSGRHTTTSQISLERTPFKYFTEAARTNFQEIKGKKEYDPDVGTSWESTVRFPDSATTDIWPPKDGDPTILSARFGKVSNRKQALEVFEELKAKMKEDLGEGWRYESKPWDWQVAQIEARKIASTLRIKMYCVERRNGYQIVLQFYGMGH